MTVVLVPTQSDPNWDQVTTLDGVDYILRFRLNQGENVYRLHIQDPVTGDDLLNGVKLVSKWPLIRRYGGMNSALPPGDLIVENNDGTDTPAGVGDFGNGRCSLYYLDLATLVSLGL